MIIFYISEYITQVIRWHYWDQSFAKSFYNNRVYRTAILTQMSINIVCTIILFLWLILRKVRLGWIHVTPLMCCLMLAILFACQFIAALSHTPEIEFQDNLVYLAQTALDLFACGFVILYFTFERVLDEHGHSQHESLGFIVFACILHIFHIIIGFVINIMHETEMCTFSIYYLISIVENILLFEILHLAIDLIHHTGAVRMVLAQQRAVSQHVASAQYGAIGQYGAGGQQRAGGQYGAVGQHEAGGQQNVAMNAD
jgi:hypothetical protein